MNTHNPQEKDMDQKVKESIVVRGISSALLSMHLPTFHNLNEMVQKYGFKLVKIK